MKIKGSNVESTPFVVLEVTYRGEVVAKLRQFWTVNSGTHGAQVCSLTWLEDQEIIKRKTTGCGYNKPAHNFSNFLFDLFGEHIPGSGGADIRHRLIGTKHHLGGNSFRIAKTTLKKKITRRS